jgi:hypothetical protein
LRMVVRLAADADTGAGGGVVEMMMDDRLRTVDAWLTSDVAVSLDYLRARVYRCATRHAQSLRDASAVGGSALDERRAGWAAQDAGKWLRAYVLVARDLGGEASRPELGAVLQHAIALLPPDEDLLVPSLWPGVRPARGC